MKVLQWITTAMSELTGFPALAIALYIDYGSGSCRVTFVIRPRPACSWCKYSWGVTAPHTVLISTDVTTYDFKIIPNP